MGEQLNEVITQEKTFTFSEKEVNDILAYLGDVPSKFANPVINFLMKKVNES
jgi:hypothetical protein